MKDKLTDQYGNAIPGDLTLLDINIKYLSPVELKNIDNLEWYAFKGNKTNHVFVSQSKLEEVLDELVDYYSSADVRPKMPLVKIDSVLHRWTEEDGFYWA